MVVMLESLFCKGAAYEKYSSRSNFCNSHNATGNDKLVGQSEQGGGGNGRYARHLLE
jgi:hypothetical protein